MRREENIFIIRPLRGWVPVDLLEVWRYRELLYFLVWREIKVRYKQTLLGVAWAVIQPFCMMVVFTFFFGRFVSVSSQGVPYPLFSYAALLPWMVFVEGVTRSANSIVADSGLIRKVYFPRLIMPLSGVISPLIDFCFAFLVFLGLMFYFKFPITVRIIWLPLIVGFAVVTSFAVGLWLSAINVRYRDVRYAIPFLIQIWFFASPVVYSSSNLPGSWHFLYSLNPMVGVIEGFRWVLLGGKSPDPVAGVSIIAVLLILFLGLIYFRRMERSFADVV
jgi:lipopolysaccharide transport system permease protein